MAARTSSLLRALFRFLLPPTLIGLTYLYFYPILTGCAFPEAKPAEPSCKTPGSDQAGRVAEKAPFRLLALADPQLEGDTSVPDQSLRNLEGIWEGLRTGNWEGLGARVEGLVKQDAPRVLQGYRKKLDLWGNDLYLAHVFAMVKSWTRPTHIVVLGDLLGSQWIGDEEFERRADRFWGTVFKGTSMMSSGITRYTGNAVWPLDGGESWTRKIFAVAGNHDVGYAGDLDKSRIERFERRFGQVNWAVRWMPKRYEIDEPLDSFSRLSSSPELRMVVLNSMNLDEPAYDRDALAESLEFLDRSLLNPMLEPGNQTAMILLTHIPLHKEEGICVDGPYFSYFSPHEGGGIREQNHLSKDVSHRILHGMAQYGSAIVLNGHDHEGCDTYHYRTQSDGPFSAAESVWKAQHSRHASSLLADADSKGIREVTVRSMMGSYGGNAGLLSAWFDEDEGRWRFEYDTCMFGVQHFWWGINVLALVELLLGVGGVVTWMSGCMMVAEGGQKMKKA